MGRILIYKWDRDEAKSDRAGLHEIIKDNTQAMKDISEALKGMRSRGRNSTRN